MTEQRSTEMRVLVACEGVDGFPNYRVTSDGRVQTQWRRGTKDLGDWRDMRPGTDRKGYLGVTLCGPASRRVVRAHRLVAETFVPNPTGLPCVRHLNGVPSDNRAENLAWGTYVQNEEDKRGHGTYEARRNGKLTAEDRQEIRRLAHQGYTQIELAGVYGVSRPTISRLVSGATWSGL